MDTCSVPESHDTEFDWSVKEAAPRLERVREEPAPERRSLTSTTLGEPSASVYYTPVHSPTEPPRESRHRSRSVKGDAFDSSPNKRHADELESPATSLLLGSVQSQNIVPSTSHASASSAPEYVEVVVRLKPTATRVPDADIKYRITDSSGCVGGGGATGRRGSNSARMSTRKSKDKLSTGTPRTSRTIARFRDVPGQVLEVWPPTLPRTPSSAALGDQSARSTLGSPRTVTAESSDSVNIASRTYHFRHVLAPNVTDAEMCATLLPEVLEQLRNQYSVCMLCYGQTGSGKTHTINALTPALLNGVFSNFINPESDVVEMSYIQIYNDRPYNLLTGAAVEASTLTSTDGGQPRIRRSARQNSAQSLGVPLRRTYGRDICEPKCIIASSAQAMSLLKHAQALRCTATHTLNARSSRAHTLMTIHITRYVDGVQPSTMRVTLADLAGSERLKKTGATGETMDEAIAINGSLSALQSLIQAKAERRTVLPTRETMLNRYLASRVMGWHLVVVVTASIEKENFAETKSSLDFANISKECPVTKYRSRTSTYSPLSGELMTPYADSEKERIRRLEEEIVKLRQVLSETRHTSQLDATRDAVQSVGPSTPLRELRDVNVQHTPSEEAQLNMTRYAELLCDREEELRQLSERDKTDQEQNESLRERVHERMEALRSVCEQRVHANAVATPASPGAAAAVTVETEISLRALENYFLQAMELTDEALERCRVEEKGRDVLLGEKRREEAKYAALLTQHEALQGAHDVTVQQCRGLEALIDELKLRVLQEKLERAVSEEASQILNAQAKQESEEIAVYRKQLEEVRNAEQDHASTMALLNKELLAAKTEMEVLQRDLKERDRTFRLLWSLASPQQKRRFWHGTETQGLEFDERASSAIYEPPVAFGAGTPVSLAQRHEVIQLRAEVASLRAQSAERESVLHMTKRRADELEERCSRQQNELEDLQERYDSMQREEERQATEITDLSREVQHFSTAFAVLQEELRKTNELLQSKKMEIERMEESQRTAQILFTHYASTSDDTKDVTASPFGGSAVANRAHHHHAATLPASNAAFYAHLAAPAPANTAAMTASFAPGGALSSPPFASTGWRQPQAMNPTPMTTFAPTHTLLAAPKALPAAAALPDHSSHQRHRAAPPPPATAPDTTSVPARADVLKLSGSGSGDPPYAFAALAGREPRDVRPAPRPRLARKTEPFSQAVPPQAAVDLRRRSSSVLSSSYPSAFATEARVGSRGAGLHPRPATTGQNALQPRNSAEPMRRSVGKRAAVPDTVTLHRKSTGSRTRRSRKPS